MHLEGGVVHFKEHTYQDASTKKGADNTVVIALLGMLVIIAYSSFIEIRIET